MVKYSVSERGANEGETIWSRFFFLPIQRLIRSRDWFRAIKPYFPSIKAGNKTVITALCDLRIPIARPRNWIIEGGQVLNYRRWSGIELSKVVRNWIIKGGQEFNYRRLSGIESSKVVRNWIIERGHWIIEGGKDLNFIKGGQDLNYRRWSGLELLKGIRNLIVENGRNWIASNKK